MFRYNFKRLILCVTLGLMVACTKDQVVGDSDVPEANNQILSEGFLVLNEGLFQHNNSRISWVDLKNNSVNNSYFEERTQRPLGDTGNDLKRYGGKLYVVVNVSSTIEVLSAEDGAHLKQIEMSENGQAKQPRSIAFSQGKAYVTCYDGYVDVIDTGDLIVTKRIPVGSNPDQIYATTEEVFVSNTGGLNFPNLDSTVSVISSVLDTEIKKTDVGLNPGKILTTTSGEIYLVVRGNYSDISPKVVQLSSNDYTLLEEYDENILGFTVMEDAILCLKESGAGYRVDKRNPSDFTIQTSDWLILDNIETPYFFTYDRDAERLFVTDAKNYTVSGDIHVFSKEGTLESTHTLYINPQNVVWFE